MNERMPDLLPNLQPPLVHGTAELTHRAFAGATLDQLMALVGGPTGTLEEAAAQALDRSTVQQLGFQKAEALALQSDALALCQVFRVASGSSLSNPTRLLALMEPGDLMTNTPLDFLTRTLNIQLDLLYLLPGRDLPAALPDHDVAYVGGGDIAAPAATARRMRLFQDWPRPVLNDPYRVSQLARVELSALLAKAPGVLSPACHRVRGDDLSGGAAMPFPVLVRPVGSHAGSNLAKVNNADDLEAYLQLVDMPEYYVTQYEDYRSADGLFRKYRILFLDRRPFLCHMGVSSNWMIHYLNAGMNGSEDKRLDEAQAMELFDTDFAVRHQAAFEALNDRIGLDYFTIDCGETRDGSLVVFEADAEAIVHLMDPPDLFPYKPPQMRRVFAAFEAMLLRRMGQGCTKAVLAA